MSLNKQRNTWFMAGMLWAMLAGSAAVADDTELFVGDTSLYPQSKPNILFILDTSGSMGTEVLTTQQPWDPNVTWPGPCDTSRVYWRTGTGNPPNCGTDRWFNRTALMCNAAATAFGTAGLYTDRMAQFDANFDVRWERIIASQKDRLIECEDDSGIHGDGSNPPRLYAQSGNASQPWTNNPSNELTWGNNPTDRTYTIYSGNWMNWYRGPTNDVQTRLRIMKDVAKQTMDTISGVKVGLMRFNRNETDGTDDGGPVIYAMEDIATARTPMQTAIENLPSSGWTPLAETLYEAGLYYRGLPVDYGVPAVPESTVAAATDGAGNYASPIEFGCQKNFVVMLTDGAPTRDTNADGKTATLIGGACDDPNGINNGKCLDDMAEYLFTTDLRTDLTGMQNVITYTIGFAVDLPILEDTAARGGGTYYTANDTATLSTALTNIVQSILDTQTTFTAPAVSVNSFNRTRTLNDLFITVFQATGDVHWPGNLKKYRLSGTEIVDADGNPAVDPVTGFFANGARSFWSAADDGPNVKEGGAANRLPDPSSRKLFSYFGDPDINAASNAITKGNTANLTNAVLGIGNPGDPARDDVIDHARGVDVTDEDQDGDMTEQRYAMGDPLHARPVSIIYGPTVDDAYIFFATNDGYLHAIDAQTGEEKWAFIPPDFLDNLPLLYTNDASSNKNYGIDGNLRIQTVADNNGTIDPGEKVYLYFGVRRGGTYYYALDISNKDDPQFLWRKTSADLPGLGQTWSTPVPTKVNVSGAAQNADKLALIFGGGYDTSQDNLGISTDGIGNAIYMVDSVSGNLLWSGRKSGGTKNFNAPGKAMDYSIPAEMKVLDLNSDGFADRMYGSDMGGQVWRFDIFNGQPASTLVNGGVIAQLGSSGGTGLVADNRRMYYSPDASLVTDDNNTYVNIAIGSGHRARPNSTANKDRFYAIRDYDAFQARSQTSYDTATPIVEGDLVDVTDFVAGAPVPVPQGSPGWKFELRTSGGFVGEKVLAESRTFDNKIFFTSFEPGAAASASNCEPALGTNRLYVVSIFDGAPVNNLDGLGDEYNLTETDRFFETSGSISSEVTFLFPSPDDPANCVGDECTPPPVACIDLFCFPPGFANNPIRTFWSEETAQ